MQKTNLLTYNLSGKGRVVIILLLFISAGLNAQFYEYGQDAGTLKWYQFKTPNYKVIYPKGVDSLAQAFADRLEYFYPYLGKPLDHQHSPIPVIIHNESSFSNGVFVWAPKRLEIFTNPDPNGYQQDWLTQLALHEGRHAVQIDKLNQGITRVLSFAGGEQVVGAMAAFLPYWYLEGDAVDAETRLSKTGRGRQPSFEMELKAQLMESNRLYTFSKATMGSYKDYIPNHYRLGYLMVRYGRLVYGDKFWVDFQQYAARKPYLFNPTFFSVRQYGLKSKKQFYQEALNGYKQHWSDMASRREITPFLDWTNDPGRHYTSYTFPQYISGSLLFAYKTGMDQIPEFILLGKSGDQQRIFRPGFLSSGRISFSGSHVVWDEFVSDTRWSNRNYSVIRTYEIATGKVKNLGRKTRFYSPAVSNDGSRIAAIEQSEKQQFNLVLLQLDGTVIQTIPSPGNQFIQHPAWMEADSALLVILSGESGKSLYSYNPGSKKWVKLFDAGFDDISFPVVYGDRIFFSGTFSGIDNIYCLVMTENETYQITSTRFGAFYPQVSNDGRDLVYSNYTSNGYAIASLTLEEGLWKPLDEARDHSEQLGYKQTDEEREITAGVLGPDTVEYTTRKYNKALHLFNFHSWLPLYFDYLNPEFNLDPENLPVSPGVSLISQNRLSTAVSQLGYEYRDGNHMFHSGIQLKGRYPVMNLLFDYGGEPDVLLLDEGDSLTALPNDLRFTVQTYVPLRFNTGKYLSIIQPRIDYSYRRDIQYVENEDSYRTGAHYLYYSLYASAYLRTGKKDILPRLGLTTSLGYYHAPFDNQVYGSVARAGVTGYLPGVLKHQTIRLAINHQKQYPLSMSRPAFINLMSLPRGLHGIFGEIMTRYSIDYVFPLLLPDLELSSVLYLKRIRGALWADHMTGTNIVIRDPEPYYTNKNYTTYGADLVVDMNLLRISFPLSVGGRVTYEPETGRTGFEWIYTIDIN
ncbi:MAG: hypothetical protein KAR19_17425 [Bacteroidales bacterium]|nr:hypothetical protein [Bacteroidales bacterium]